MDLSEYDQFVPEKELDMNFKIPRRPNDVSVGTTTNYGEYSGNPSQYASNARPLSDYIGLSGAASRASVHSNYRGPVPYTDVSKLDTSVKPPNLTATQSISIAAAQYANANTGFNMLGLHQNTTVNPGNMTNSKWDTGYRRYPNQTNANNVPPLPNSTNNNKISTQTASSDPAWNNADLKRQQKQPDFSYEPALPVQAVTSKYSGASFFQVPGHVTGAVRTWNYTKKKTEQKTKTYEELLKWKTGQGTEAARWNDDENAKWNNSQNWMNPEPSSGEGNKRSENDKFSGNRSSVNEPDANEKPQEWSGNNANRPSFNNFNKNQGNANESDANEKPQEWSGYNANRRNNFNKNQGNTNKQGNNEKPFGWTGNSGIKFNKHQGNAGDQGANDRSFSWKGNFGNRGGHNFNRNQGNMGAPAPNEGSWGWKGNNGNKFKDNFDRNQEENAEGWWDNERSFGWNRGGNSNRGFRGRGGMKRRGGGFRNDFNNQGNFGNTSVLDNEEYADTSLGGGPGRGPRYYQSNDGPKNAGKFWNKSEKPKKPKITTPPVVIADVSDETLPKDLRDMFQPLFCKLCSIQMSSNVMAKMHYVSKNHEKKIRKYLVEHAEKTGDPLHPRANVTESKKEKEEDKDPKNFYCELCDLQLTGKQHADSHYMGKSHNAVRMGRKRPAGQGCYDANGKWIRKNKEAKLEYAEGEDTFGMDFKQKQEETVTTEAPTVPNPLPVVKTIEQFTCSLCSVNCISQEQLNIHFSGAKHKKKLKANGLSPDNFILKEETETQPKVPIVEVAVSADQTTTEDTDDSLKSKYITPNGCFYCEKCNLTVNSENQFKQHLGSKNHAKKANATKTQ